MGMSLMDVKYMSNMHICKFKQFFNVFGSGKKSKNEGRKVLLFFPHLLHKNWQVWRKLFSLSPLRRPPLTRPGWLARTTA